MILEAIDSLTFEWALGEMQLCAALLPPTHVPVPWLREWVVEVRPTLGAYPQVLDALVQTLFSQGTLRRGLGSPEVAQADERITGAIRDATEETALLTSKKRLRDFGERKLNASRAESSQRVNRVMTGDPLLAVTAWTVPPLAEVRARATGDDRVEIVEFGDGTYSVRAKPLHEWEEECLKALVTQEFTSADLAGIEWAIRMRLLGADELRQAEMRIGELHRLKPDNHQAALVASLFWLNLAHRCYGEGGSARTSWYLAGKAVEMAQELHHRQPDEPTVAALLDDAKQAYWSYDD